MDILYIIWFDVLPILVFLGGGWFLAGKFKIEVKTYEIVITRVVLPCFVFFNLYQVPPAASDLLLLPAALLLTAILFVLSALLARWLSQEPSLRQAICGMASCPNICYLGGVLTYLTFSHLPFASAGEAGELPKALALLSLLMTLSHLLLRTVGHAIVSKESFSLPSLLLRALTTPVLYGALLAFAAAHFDIPLKGTFLYPVLHHFTGAFIVLTAVTTGVMIRRSHCFTVSKDILLPALVKLLVSPLLALGLLAIFPSMDDLAKEILLLFAAIPCAMDFSMVDTTSAQKSIFQRSLMTQMSLSILTLPLVIFLCRLFFPASM